MSKKAKILIAVLSSIVFLSGCTAGGNQISNQSSKEGILSSPQAASEETISEPLGLETASESVSEAATEETSEQVTESSVVDATSPTFALVELPEATETQEEPTEKITEIVAATEPSSETAEETATEEATDATLYGVCNKDTVAKITNGNSFALCEGQKVRILRIGEEFEILWYDSTAMVAAEDINVFPKDYVPDFTKGQWAGCITN